VKVRRASEPHGGRNRNSLGQKDLALHHLERAGRSIPIPRPDDVALSFCNGCSGVSAEYGEKRSHVAHGFARMRIVALSRKGERKEIKRHKATQKDLTCAMNH